MAYINKDGKIGTLYQLLPNVSNPILFTEAELKEMGIEPYVEKVKVPTLEEMKAQQLNGVKNTHTQIKEEGFMTSLGFKIDCKDRDVNNFANGKQLLDASGVTETIVIDYDNQTHTISATDYTKIVLELGGYVMQLLKEKQIMRGLINVATTKTALKKVYWRKGVYDEDGMTLLKWEYNPLMRS